MQEWFQYGKIYHVILFTYPSNSSKYSLFEWSPLIKGKISNQNIYSRKRECLNLKPDIQSCTFNLKPQETNVDVGSLHRATLGVSIARKQVNRGKYISLATKAYVLVYFALLRCGRWKEQRAMVKFSKTSMFPTFRCFVSFRFDVEAFIWMPWHPKQQKVGNIEVSEIFQNIDVSETSESRKHRGRNINASTSEKSDSRNHWGFGKLHFSLYSIDF